MAVFRVIVFDCHSDHPSYAQGRGRSQKQSGRKCFRSQCGNLTGGLLVSVLAQLTRGMDRKVSGATRKGQVTDDSRKRGGGKGRNRVRNSLGS